MPACGDINRSPPSTAGVFPLAGPALSGPVLPGGNVLLAETKLPGAPALGTAGVAGVDTVEIEEPDSAAARYEVGWPNGLFATGSDVGVGEFVVASGAGPNINPRPSSRPLTTSGKFLPNMANNGTLISTISMSNARNAMAVDDCIGRTAPSKTFPVNGDVPGQHVLGGSNGAADHK